MSWTKRAAAMMFGGALIAALLPATTAAAVPPIEKPRVQQGDLLISNHSFESGTDGWTASNGRGAAASQACAVTSTQDWATDGSSSLTVGGDTRCIDAGAVSSTVTAVAGEKLTAFAAVRNADPSSIGLRFTDDDGNLIKAEQTKRQRRKAGSTLELTATVPEGATKAAVELGALRGNTFDNVLISGTATSVGSQINKRMSFLAMGDGVDANGRAIVVTVGTGSEEDSAKLIATDVLTGKVTEVVDLPGAVGSWTVAQNPVSKIFYVGTYSSAALWSWKPGESEATRIGTPPIKGFGFTYGLSFGTDGTVYGGGWGEPTDGYAGAAIWKYTEGQGFGAIGTNPLTTDANYTRWTAYEETTDAVFTGTGTKAHLYGCNATGAQTCKEFTSLLSPALQSSAWLYTGKASDGYLTVWGGDSQSRGNDYLAILKVSRDGNGELQADVVTEIKGVIYAGPSDIVDGKVYFNKAGETSNPLHSYDLATGEERTITSAPVNIFSRGWEAMQLDDPAWPGTTIVGWNSGGWLTKWNIDTEKFERTLTEDIPDTSTRVTNLSSGADGNIWSAGYLTGGLGKVAPMRSDQQTTYTVGGQAESMINYRGKVYQGTYPNARIESFDPATQTGQAPTVECAIGERQNRPYGLHGSGDRLYFGSQAEYGFNKGAFGWLNLTSGECTTIVGPLGEQSINAITSSKGKVFGGGNVFFSYDGIPTEEQAKLLIFDEATGEHKAVEWPIPGTRSINAAATSADGTVWLYAEGWLVGMDPISEKIIVQQEIFPDLKPGNRIGGSYGEMIVNTDGKLYGNVGGRVFSFDPVSTRKDKVADASLRIHFAGAGAHLTNDQYGNIYVPYGSTQLLRLNPR
ncbi:hypothetical protein ACQBAR_09170 [Propionibacteriaceae bacterium Y1685]